MARVALLDGDLLLYKEAAGVEKRIQWTDDPADVTYSVGDFQEALDRAERALDSLFDRLKAEHVVVCLSCPSAEGFRRQVLPTYKAHRSSRKPEHLAELKEWLRSEYVVYERPLLEADDLLGILATAPNLLHEFKSRIIVSGDKDLLTIPGTLYNPDKDRIHKTTEAEADHRFFMQVLTGDPTDGYTGIPGVGPVKAAGYLAESAGGSPWDRIVSAYTLHGLTEADALQQARVARILRASDYDFKAHRPILWEPPK